MKRIIFTILILCAAFSAYAAEVEKIEFASGKLIAKFKDGITLADIQQLLSQYGFSSAEPLFKQTPFSQTSFNNLKEKLIREKQLRQGDSQGIELPNLENIYVLTTNQPQANILGMAQALSINPNVVYAEPNYLFKAHSQELPNDYLVSHAPDGITWSKEIFGAQCEDLWALKKIEADKAWEISQGKNVVVAVIDTGIDCNHPDLKENIWLNQREIPGNGIDDDQNGFIDDYYGYDFVADSANPIDRFGHGTHVAGIIASTGDNNIGIIGVAPQAKLMSIKAMDDQGRGFISDAAKAVRYTADNGAQVINVSWGVSAESLVLIDVMHYAYLKGCVVVASVGNDNVDAQAQSPANIDTVIAVATSDQKDEKYSASNYGRKIDVFSPGVDIVSTMSDSSVLAGAKQRVANGYYILNGTSVAAPYVSGTAALILAKNKNLTADQVRFALQMSADRLASLPGRLNAFKAVEFDPADYKVGISLKDKSIIKSDRIEIRGSASLGSEFEKYELSYQPKDKKENLPSGIIKSSTYSKQDDFLGFWDTDSQKLPDGKYILTLKAITREGLEIACSKEVIIANLNEPYKFMGSGWRQVK